MDREPDFVNKMYGYWFKEMVCKLVDRKLADRKGVVIFKLIEKNNKIYWRSNNKLFMESPYVQAAYQNWLVDNILLLTD